MKRISFPIWVLLLSIILSVSLFGCAKEENKVDNNSVKPSLAGISLGDSKEGVQKKLGKEYELKDFEEAGHFPENFYSLGI